MYTLFFERSGNTIKQNFKTVKIRPDFFLIQQALIYFMHISISVLKLDVVLICEHDTDVTLGKSVT